MKRNTKRLTLVALSLSFVCFLVGAFILPFNTRSVSGAESKGVIEVYLIGGQSNAVGYGMDNATDKVASLDPRFSNGFENVLYYGNQERAVGGDGKLIPITQGSSVKIGLGQTHIRCGAELGIAPMVADNGGMNAVIKCAWGATYLYPDLSANVSKNYGTWTSPSYIEENAISTDGNRIGDMYTWFLDTVKMGLEDLEAQGYTPVIKGMWWMQGEAESNNNAIANQYDELLTALISDLRVDLSTLSGIDQSNMPFVVGSIYRNPTATPNSDIDTVNNAQLQVASELNNVAVVDISTCPVLRQHDSWHFDAQTQKWIGEQFVAKVNAMQENVQFEENIAIFEDAGIRFNAPSGIRFGAKVIDYNEENDYDYGMVILPKDYLETYNVKSNFVTAFENKGVDIVNLECNVLYGDFDGDGYEENYIQGSLVDIKYENVNREFVAIGYIKNGAGQYTYTGVSYSFIPSVLASRDMHKYEKGSDEYLTAVNYVNAGINQKMGVDKENGYDFANFSITLENKVVAEISDLKNIAPVQEPAMGYHVNYISEDESIATVDEDGNVTVHGDGQTKITVQCGIISTIVEVTAKASPILDGVIEEEYYKDNFINYDAYGQTNSLRSGMADIDMYYYESSNNLYLAFDVVGTASLKTYKVGTTTRPAAAITFFVKNNKTNEGNFYRFYANGDVRINSLANVYANGNAYTGWTSTTVNNIDFASVKYTLNKYTATIVDSYVVELKVSYEELGASSASDISILFGWHDLVSQDMVYKKDGTPIRYAEDYDYKEVGEDFWWTFDEIKQAKATRAIRLDGYVDEAYVNSFTYYHASTNATYGAGDNSTTRLHWYEDSDALYLAFEVTPSQARTIKNTDKTGTQGTAGINFSIYNPTTNTAVWHRAFASLINHKTFTENTVNFYSCTNARLDYIRGNEGALIEVERISVVKTYVIEVRIGYAEFGVKDASEIKVSFGGLNHGGNNDWGEWICKKDGTTYSFASTGDATAAGYVADFDGDYYWTLADFVAMQEAQKNANA